MKMENSTGTQPVKRFGVFELDPLSGELRKRGVRIRLQDKPLQILVALMERPGEVVTREQLCKLLYPGDSGTLIDLDNSLNIALRKLRVALSDSAQTPRFIETLPGRGYRFIGSPSSNEETPPAPPPQARVRRRFAWLLAAG